MATQAAYTVRHVDSKHAGALPPIAFEIREGMSAFSFTDYLTADEAMRVAAKLTHAAMQVREGKAEATVEVEKSVPRLVTNDDGTPVR